MNITRGRAILGAKIRSCARCVPRLLVGALLAVGVASSTVEAQVSPSTDQPAVLVGPIVDFAAIEESQSGSASCSTTWEGTQYVGDCATPQEIADAIATIDALKEDVEQDWDDARESCLTLEDEPTHCMYDEEESSGSLDAWSARAFTDQRFVSFSEADDMPDGSSSTSCMESRYAASAVAPADMVRVGDCVGAGLAAAGSVVGWLAAHVAAHDTLVIGASRSGVAAAVAGLVAGAFTTGYGIGTWLQCLAE